MMNLPGVLFLSLANSARSQIAEGLALRRFGDRLRILSAGQRPTQIHPLAIETLEKVGIDAAHHRSKPVDEIDLAGIDLVVTLGDQGGWPTWLAGMRHLHWPIPDPAGGLRAESSSILGAGHEFRRARLEIEAKLDLIEPALVMTPGVALAPARGNDREEVESLLIASELPIDGLDTCFLDETVVARLDGELVGVAGLERWQAFGLLRSVAVAETERGRHLADVLVTDRLCAARFLALDSVYLLTHHASGFFARLGFTTIERDELPAALAPSTELTLPACSDATAMKKQLVSRSGTLARVDSQIAEELAAYGELVPPWAKYPAIPRRSIGWRMGSGEWYLWAWQRWWQGADPAERKAYRDRWLADVPPQWQGWLAETDD